MCNKDISLLLQQKVLIKVYMHCDKSRKKAMSIAVQTSGKQNLDNYLMYIYIYMYIVSVIEKTYICNLLLK